MQHNHRQGDEKEWADALNEFRVGVVSEKGDAMLRERQTTEQFLVEDAMHIFYRNRNVKGHNDRMLNSLPSNTVSNFAGLPRCPLADAHASSCDDHGRAPGQPGEGTQG